MFRKPEQKQREEREKLSISVVTRAWLSRARVSGVLTPPKMLRMLEVCTKRTLAHRAAPPLLKGSCAMANGEKVGPCGCGYKPRQ